VELVGQTYTSRFLLGIRGVGLVPRASRKKGGGGHRIYANLEGGRGKKSTSVAAHTLYGDSLLQKKWAKRLKCTTGGEKLRKGVVSDRLVLCSSTSEYEREKQRGRKKREKNSSLSFGPERPKKLKLHTSNYGFAEPVLDSLGKKAT